MTDTLAERMRERAREFAILNGWASEDDPVVDDLTAFALSELSAAEKAVRKEEICGQNATLDADFVGCGKPISDPYKVFRCTDCGVPFHLKCANKHFENGDVLTEEVIQAQGHRWKERGLCEGCGQTEEQCKCERRSATASS